MIEPSEDSFETMMERKNPSSKQMESSEGSSNTTVETSGSQAQLMKEPTSGSAQERKEPPRSSAQEVEELPTDLLQDMEEPSSGPHQEIEDPPNDLLQDMEESCNGSRQAMGGPRHEAAGRMGEPSVKPCGDDDEEDSDTDLSEWSDEEQEEEEEGQRWSEEELRAAVRSITSLYYQMQDLREHQRVAEKILLNGLHDGQLPLPLPFTGDRREYREFIVLCQLILQNYPRLFYNDRLRIGYVITHLSGLALEWAKGLLQNESPMINNFPGFLAAMSNVFEYRQALKMAEEAMFSIKQKNRPAAAYIAEFQSLVPILGWPDEVLQAHLCQGLNEDIRHYLFRVPQPESLESLIVLVLQIEEKLAERRALLRLPPEARPRNLTWIDSPSPEKWMVNSWLPNEVHPAIERAHIFLLLMVRVSPYHSVAVQALVDSGAGSNFMDERFAQEHYVELYEKTYPQQVQTADGSLVGDEPVWLYTEPLVCIHQNHHEYIEFDIIPSPIFSVILGVNWLRTHSPDVDWIKGRCTFHSPYCLQNCFRPPPPCIALERQGLSLLPGLPPPYSDLADVFNPKEADDETSDQPSSDGSDDLSESEPSELQQAGDSDHDEIFYECPSTASWEPASTGMQDRARLHDEYWDPQDMLTNRQDYIQMIPELFDQLHGATWFTKLELRGTIVEESMRIHQAEDVWRAAFGLEYQEMDSYQPFEISSDPVVPQSVIHCILKGMLGYFVITYGQDVVIYSMSQEEHPHHVRQVLVRFRRHNIYCSLEKSQFHRNTIEFLGFVITPKGVKLNKSLVTTVTGYPIPGSKKSLRHLIEFIFPYRHFVERFIIIIEPLLRQLLYHRGFYWGDEEQEAFECLKRAFRKAPLLHHPKPQNPFFLETGVTKTSLHAALIQVDEQTGKKVYCAFYSRNISPIEDDYSQLEMRILPIRAAFTVWCRYLENTEEPIMILLNTEDLASLNNDRLTVLLPGHWVFFFSHFNFDVMEWPTQDGHRVRLPHRGHRPGAFHPETFSQHLLLFRRDSQGDLASAFSQEGENGDAQHPGEQDSQQTRVALLPIDQIVNTFLLQFGAVQVRAVVLHFLRSLLLWKSNLALATILLMLKLRPRLLQMTAPNPLVAQPGPGRPLCLILDSSLITNRGMANAIAELLIRTPPLVVANTLPVRERPQLFLGPGHWQRNALLPQAHQGLQLTPNFWLLLCEFFGVSVTPGDERHPAPREQRSLELHIVDDENVILREAQQGDLQRYRQGGLHDGLQDSPQDDQENAVQEAQPRDAVMATAATVALPTPRHSQAHPAVLAFLRDTRATERRPALLTRGLVARLLIRFLRMARAQAAPSTVRASPPRDGDNLEEPPNSHEDRDQV
ncbi:PREDICTED: retrotransposon-like protein 1-like [Chrysochloris asiatica]|uniref:Retrotransposon-like protein 1-like n=1 Tax=Chrysochloris asiatica TaxID=185453 RepID=A0A9B0T3Y8_CHRAS|nr:PREDICTED: retrotransposon-like protein 1-like [Chrysochloris asiatica]